MALNLKGRSLPNLLDYTKEEIIALIDLAIELKNKKKNGIMEKRLANKNIALLFEKASTRTRCAFAVAASDEGAHTEYLSAADVHLGKKESIEDTARVLGRMFDAIEFRGFKQEHVEKLIEYSGVPVFNGLTDDYHPTQALADLMTVKEHFGYYEGIQFAYVGDGRNNVANSLMIICAKLGVKFRIIAPKSLWPLKELVEQCTGFATQSGGKIAVTDNIETIKGAQVVYTDVWVSMGEEAQSSERLQLLKPYQVNAPLMAKAATDAIFMHCLPAVKGNEVTKEVFEAHADVVFDEAENRMHTIKAVMVASMVD